MPDSITTKTLPSSDASSAQTPDANPAVRQTEADAEESKPVASMGLSSKFDSFGAAMRLAAMTAPEDAETVGKTLKMDAAKQAASGATKHTSAIKANSSKSAFSSGNLVLIMIALLILLILALVL